MSEYSAESLEICKRVVRSINAESGVWGPKCVVIGGLVPSLLGIEPHEGLQPHLGTTDVDFGVQVAALADEAELYRTLKSVLLKLGFKQTGGEPSFAWTREIDHFPAKIELFCSVGNQSEGGRIQKKPFSQPGSGLTALGIYGLDLIAKDVIKLDDEGPLLDNQGVKKVSISVCGPAMFMLLKGWALHERSKDKDGYDVVWVLRALGAEKVAAKFNEAGLHQHNAGILALEFLSSAFESSAHTGPNGWVATSGFVLDEREREKREAVGIVAEFCRLCRELAQ